MNPRDLEKLYFGEFRVEEESSSGDQLMVISSTLSSKAELEALAANLAERRKIKHDHLVDLKRVERDEKRSWCSTNYSMKAFYEYFPNNLKKEFLLRRKKRASFSSLEILRLAFDGVDVLSFLQENDIKHGEVNPNVIFLFRDRFDDINRLKICERFTGHNDKQMNYIHAISSNMDLYLEPQIFEALSKNARKVPVTSPYK